MLASSKVIVAALACCASAVASAAAQVCAEGATGNVAEQSIPFPDVHEEDAFGSGMVGTVTGMIDLLKHLVQVTDAGMVAEVGAMAVAEQYCARQANVDL